MIIVFNTTYYEEECKLVENRSLIAKRYLSNQFWLDFFPLIPFDYVLVAFQASLNMNQIILFRLIKMIRITRLFKVYNQMSDLTQSSYFRDVLKIDASAIRLWFFLFFFLIICHFTSCLFVILAHMHQEGILFKMNDETTWIDDYNHLTVEGRHVELYCVSFYYTITTITTVGYGDISAVNFVERVFCSILMVLGVIAFSFANGSLTSLLTTYDNKKVVYIEKLETLNTIQKRHNLPP